MFSYIISHLTGRAAKAGMALLTGLIGAPGAVAGVEHITGSDAGMTILGYVIVGALGGLINWANVYFTRNKPAEQFPPRPGLY